MKFFTTSKLSENIHETPEGYLVCVGVSIARTGEMVYGVGETPIEPGPDGKVIIQRDQTDVFRPETVASFEGKSFTVLHPEDFVSPKNWKELTSGIIQNVKRGTGEQENDLVADILVTDAKAIALIKAGIREVSCGYEAEYIETGRGRGIQKSIVGNHVALVDKGRAGESYAINDHRGGVSMKLSDRIKSIFAKAQDEAMKAADGLPDMPAEVSAYDKMCGMMKDMGSLLESMKPKDASTAPTQAAPAQIEADAKPEEKKSEEKPAGDSEEEMEKKKAARDAWIDAQMEKEAKSKEESKDEEGEEESEEKSEDASEEKGEASEESEEESEDEAGEEESELTGDSASRIEILAPGLKAQGKDAKAQALKACYATKDGKSIIERFTDGKEVDYANTVQVDSVFIGASEILKSERAKALAGTRTFDFQNSSLSNEGALSAEDLNKKMATHYGSK